MVYKVYFEYYYFCFCPKLAYFFVFSKFVFSIHRRRYEHFFSKMQPNLTTCLCILKLPKKIVLRNVQNQSDLTIFGVNLYLICTKWKRSTKVQESKFIVCLFSWPLVQIYSLYNQIVIFLITYGSN